MFHKYLKRVPIYEILSKNIYPNVTRNMAAFKHTKPSFDTSEPEEVSITVPWGHVAAKWWGPKDVRPILGLHGWLDNAGTFDRLAPLLPPHISLLAIDFPGHGHSSRLPPGMAYDKFNFIQLIRLVQKEYKWDKISLMGHSLGAIIGFGYTSIFSDEVDMMIAIDGLKFFYYEPDMFVPITQEIMNGLIVEHERHESQSEPPSYPFDELINKLHDGMMGAIDKEVAPYLLRRGIKKSEKYPDRYYFVRDGRVKFLHALTFDKELCNTLANNVKAPYLFIASTGSGHINREDSKYTLEFLEHFKTVHSKLEMHTVEGKHHVHLNDPTKVVNIISEFIEKHRPASISSKL